MIFQIFLLASAGLAISALLDRSEGEGEHVEEGVGNDDEEPIHNLENDLLAGSAILEDLSAEDTSQIGSIAAADETVFSDEGSIEVVTENNEVPTYTDERYLATESTNVVTLDFKSVAETHSTAPLDDFNSNPKTENLDIDDFDYIHLDFDPDDGHVEALQSDYYERFGEEESVNNSEILHTGVNFYFVPQGEEFPEDYTWSKDSANLYNNSTFINESEDFGGIRLILRVDTGVILNSSHADEMQISNDRMGELEKVVFLGSGHWPC